MLCGQIKCFACSPKIQISASSNKVLLPRYLGPLLFAANCKQDLLELSHRNSFLLGALPQMLDLWSPPLIVVLLTNLNAVLSAVDPILFVVQSLRIHLFADFSVECSSTFFAHMHVSFVHAYPNYSEEKADW